jgi:hypothetical protein
MRGGDVVLFDKVVELRTEGGRTIIKVELSPRARGRSISSRMARNRTEGNEQAHPDDSIRSTDDVPLLDTLISERTDIIIRPLLPARIRRVPVVGLGRTERGEPRARDDLCEPIEPCLGDGRGRGCGSGRRVGGLPLGRSGGG